MVEILMVRHGEPEAHTGTGPKNPNLTDNGIAQAKRVGGEILQLTEGHSLQVVTSSLSRAQQTAFYALGHELVQGWQVDPDFDELRHNISRQRPGELTLGLARSPWTGTNAHVEDGESIAAMTGRSLRALRRHAASIEPDSMLVVFGHSFNMASIDHRLQSHLPPEILRRTAGLGALSLAQVALAAKRIPYGGIMPLYFDKHTSRVEPRKVPDQELKAAS